jgi:hypothetical protein
MAPSREARMRVSTQHVLPPGVWHTSAWAAPTLAQITPIVRDAVHVATGARFRLVSAGDQILSVSAEDRAAEQLVIDHWDDPSTWANEQRWKIVPSTPTEPESKDIRPVIVKQCPIWGHSQRSKIEADLVSGVPTKHIGEMYAVYLIDLRNHLDSHMLDQQPKPTQRKGPSHDR